ncbi:hypothetical protein V8F33_008505 [Rhypophila sp. PSN 637]
MASYPELKLDLSRFRTVRFADTLTEDWNSESRHLNNQEQKLVGGWESWNEKTIAAEVRRRLSLPILEYQQTENQILSLLIAWRTVIHEKKRYDKFMSSKNAQSKHWDVNGGTIRDWTFLRVTDIVPRRVMIGMRDIDSVGIENKDKKRKSIESDDDDGAPSRRMKRLRIKDTDEESLSGESDYEGSGSDGEKGGPTDEEEEPYQRKNRNPINILFKKQPTQQPYEERHQMSKKRRR